MHRSRDRSAAPVAITSVAPSLDDQHDARRRKYLIMMGLRVVCVVAAAAVFRSSLWLALLFIVGGAVLPWCAVLIANDRPARSRTAFIGYRPPSQGQLPRQQAHPADDSSTHPTFDSTAFDSTAFDSTAFDSTAFDSTAFDDTAFDDTAFDDSQFDGPAGHGPRPSPAQRPPGEWLDPHQDT